MSLQSSKKQQPIPSSATVAGVAYIYDSSMGATAQEVKASAGSLYGYHLINPNTTIAYVQIFNTASGSVTVGTTTPIMLLAIPPQGSLEMVFTIPISFSTAIVYACTTTIGGNTAMTTPPYGTFFYK